MTERRNGLRLGVLLAGFAALGGGIAHGQFQNSRGSQTTMPSGMDTGNSNTMKTPPEIRERMEKARNDDRQKRLIADTDKLLALATSLKTDVDKTDKYTLSVDVIRRTEEIEKLSKAIRERMKQ